MKNNRYINNEKKEIILNLLNQNKTTKEISAITGYPVSVIRYYREPSKHNKCSQHSQKVSEHRRKIKRKSVDYSGGQCLKCGYNKCQDALAFHHIDPNEKDYGLASGFTNSWEKFKSECDKCLLLCHNCHSEFHAGLWVITDEIIAKQHDVRLMYVDKPLICYR